MLSRKEAVVDFAFIMHQGAKAFDVVVFSRTIFSYISAHLPALPQFILAIFLAIRARTTFVIAVLQARVQHILAQRLRRRRNRRLHCAWRRKRRRRRRWGRDAKDGAVGSLARLDLVVIARMLAVAISVALPHLVRTSTVGRRRGRRWRGRRQQRRRWRRWWGLAEPAARLAKVEKLSLFALCELFNDRRQLIQAERCIYVAALGRGRRG